MSLFGDEKKRPLLGFVPGSCQMWKSGFGGYIVIFCQRREERPFRACVLGSCQMWERGPQGIFVLKCCQMWKRNLLEFIL